ncbi:hypothetical protein LTR10_021524 [Elasticomyces elasticus]|uniref:ABM domain-containing protein n=1 Tax=Exophiala sideris TaxID=1016849 RepID=A0ABR0J8M6_9EURO|nr:hypothetical protein LTR10_021524 [Elasticomyces elasticus]KAK5027980.1 hypothetical protein LTS07_006856 [Exophiala sideris]KAK5037429.1 hypothetical protein LTR13_004586 [Exophiala sideris]KAK5059091.1 hypothetical protein LTR69_006380 [Exophiala sideris]KAK5182924.1 hypothetical protein LTR44_004634 [Eurotiomycetes sp. CCFEE 6388]
MGVENHKAASVTLLHPKSVEAKKEAIHALVSQASFFRLPEMDCLAYTYFQPATRPKANLGMVPSDEKDTLVGVVQTFSSPKAVEQAGQYFKLKSPLTEKEDRTVWYPAAGFVARKGAKETPKAKIVMLAKFVTKETEGARDKLVQVLGSFCNWVEDNEPTTLTYCVMTRPDSPNEVLLFERYKDLGALGVHGKTKEFKAMFKGTGPFVQGRKTVLSEWEELDDSFVSNDAGGAGLQPKL